MRELVTEVAIDAKPDKVWATFTDFQSLPKWQSWLNITSHGAAKEVEVGKTIAVCLQPENSSPFNVKPQVLVNGSKEFRWRGRLWDSDWFFVGEHYFRAEPGGQGSNSTRFVHGEQFQGLLVPLLGGVLSKTEQDFNRFNQKLKNQVESAR